MGVLAVIGLLMLSDAVAVSAYPGAPWFQPDAPYTQNFPDPMVVRDGSTYWAYATSTGGSLMPAMSSTDLLTWTPRPALRPNPYNSDPYFNDAFPVPPRWTRRGTSRDGNAQWGPGVAKFGATWVGFTSWEVSDTRRCISMATAASPAGPFTDASATPFQCDLDPAGSIDPEPFTDIDGTTYLLWKSAGVVGSTPTRLWSRRLSADGRSFAPFSAPNLLLATDPGSSVDGIPQEDTWEGHGIENPSMVHHGGSYWLIYSGNEWRSGDYRMGQARCAGPAGPCTRSSTTPLLANTETELGRGGGSIFTDGDGRLHLIDHFWNAPFTDYPPFPDCERSGACTTQGQRRQEVMPLSVVDGSLRVQSEAPAISAGPGGLVATAPVRALDTRETGRCVGEQAQTITMRSRNSVPADAAAVALNVTVTEPTASGFLTVWPTGSPRPSTSNLNFEGGQTIANMVTVKVGGNGSIKFASNLGCPHVIVDIAGYYRGGTPAGGGFVGITPVRALDTRGERPCVSSEPRTLMIAGPRGIPSTASSVVLNVTVTEPTATGFLTVWPAGRSRPNSSNLNFLPGQTVPNMVTVKVGDNGSIELVSNQGCPQVIVDIAGYYRTGSPTAGGFVGLSPRRALDTRISGPCVSSEGRSITLAGRFGIPQSADPGIPGTSAVALTVTVTDGTAPGFLTVWPSGGSQPTASNVNFVPGRTTPNMVIVSVGAGGAITLRTNQGCPQVIVDIAGYFTMPLD
jgi:Glycosyl hydrolases family 43